MICHEQCSRFPGFDCPVCQLRDHHWENCEQNHIDVELPDGSEVHVCSYGCAELLWLRKSQESFEIVVEKMFKIGNSINLSQTEVLAFGNVLAEMSFAYDYANRVHNWMDRTMTHKEMRDDE